MTTKDRDITQRKIVKELINYIEDSELNVVWEELDEDDQKEIEEKFNSIVRRYLVVKNENNKRS